MAAPSAAALFAACEGGRDDEVHGMLAASRAGGTLTRLLLRRQHGLTYPMQALQHRSIIFRKKPP